eukprot:gene20590-24470_t
MKKSFRISFRPDDANLLNAIFRGFHTVKGGAGFLQLHELVECCHIAENVFDILRKGERHVDSELMDVILEALDAVNGMFTVAEPVAEPAGDVTDSEFEQLLDSLNAVKAEAEAPAASAPAMVPTTEDITDAEFESLLDQLHGKGQFAPDAVAAAPAPTEAA